MPGFDLFHSFGYGGAWAIGVMRDSFNKLNEYLVRLRRRLVNAPLVENIAGFVYAIFRVAEVLRELS